MGRVDNKVIIVTGGASGIGQAACQLLAEEGAKIAIMDINQEAGLQTEASILSKGGKAKFWPLNVCDEKNIQAVFKDVYDFFGNINVLVNNVGMIGDNKPTHELTEAEWDKVMSVNVKSVFLCTKHIISYLQKAKSGSIINISSLHGLIGSPDYPANHASKAAIRLMSKTDAMLYAKDNIRVNSIHPGYIWTPLLEEVAKKSEMGYEQYKQHQATLQPIGFLGEPIDIAYAILYLASDESRFMTASDLVIDGGIYGGRKL
jgi:NAD(P)-dependent dehydrogenase (short-subunit alcohol dehydrogenase family)